MFYEPYSELSPKARTMDNAIQSLMEELEAINYYNQRSDAATDDSLKALMDHNRDEEIEHAAMLIEWLRRDSKVWDEQLRLYLFTEAPITEVEEEAMDGGDGGNSDGKKSSGSASLGLGSLRK